MIPVLIIITLGSILFLYMVAGKRDPSKKIWVIMGLLFGPLAIPFVFFSKTKEKSG
jgi:hypothetical protein